MDLHLDRTFKYNWLMFKRHDLSAGLTVFLVALPLCLGVALASGAPLYSGILSGIILIPGIGRMFQRIPSTKKSKRKLKCTRKRTKR